MMQRLPTLTLALSLAACGSRSRAPDQPLEQVEDPAAAQAVARGDETGHEAAQSPSRDGQVARADLNRLLDAGPGAFLARAEVKARVVKGQFHGWEVVRTPYPELDLRPGDVILSVNGSILEHPVDLERLWTDLRAANAIAVDVERGEKRFALRFSIVPQE
jgi:hypothetical protein